MKTINISNKTLRKLNRYCLDKNINNTEAKLYLFLDKNKWDKNLNLLKIFYNKTGPSFSNKMYTINELIENSGTIGIEELIIPERLAVVNGEISGCKLPYINNTNFKTLLDDFSIPNKSKLDMFKQIGEILDKMKKVRENTTVSDLFLNDLH